jgi:formylglycine-generating enzyme required for sulfatase activity
MPYRHDDLFGRFASVLRLKPGVTAFMAGLETELLREVNEPWCPELVAIPPGKFWMGSTKPERRWAIQQGAQRDRFYQRAQQEWVSWEKTHQQVVVSKALAVGKYPVTRGQYLVFIEATAHDMSGDCMFHTGNKWEQSSSADWRFPGFEQTDDHPVVCVSWGDAQAYLAWLSEKTNQPYRLLSEAEWEYACRTGTTRRYSWGDDPPTPEQANFAMNVGKTTEVGSYPANPWGLHDMHGNVWEWVQDCWNKSHTGAPTGGSAWTSGNNSRRVLRGGSWNDEPENLRSALRYGWFTDYRSSYIGFRVARTLR